MRTIKSDVLKIQILNITYVTNQRGDITLAIINRPTPDAYHAHKTPPLDPILSQLNSVHNLKTY